MKTKPTIQKVIFRASRRKNPEISAVIVDTPGSPSAPLCVWDSSCGHGAGTWDWYYSTRPAQPAEYAEELEKLRRQYAPEFLIKVVKKYTSKDRDSLQRIFSRLTTLIRA